MVQDRFKKKKAVI